MLSRPRLIYDGVSKPPPSPMEAINLPESSHTPLFLVVADRGDYRPIVTNIAGASTKYGISDSKSDPLYTPHVTAMLMHLANGGVANFIRIPVEGVKKAIARLSIVMDMEDNDSYGYYFVVTEPTDVGSAIVRTSGRKTTYPIFDIQYNEDGTHGNDIGFELLSANNGTKNSLSPEEINRYLTTKSFPYVVKMIERNANQKTTIATAIGTLDGTSDNVFVELNQRCGNKLTTHTYSNSVWALQQVIFNAEETYPPSEESTEIDRPSHVDIVGHTDQFGTLCQSTYPIDNPSEFMLIEGNPFFLSGGDNGVDSTSPLSVLQRYDEAVNAFLSVDSLQVLADPVRAPFRSFYDTGFSIRTKLRLFNLKKVRPEITLIISAYSIADYSGEDITPPPSGISCAGAEDELFFGIASIVSEDLDQLYELTYEIDGVETTLSGLTQTDLRDQLNEIPGMEAIGWDFSGGQYE